MSGEHSQKKKPTLAIRKSQIKTTLRLHFTTVKMAKIKKKKINAHMDVGEGKHSLIAGGSANCSHCGHQCGGVAKKLKINLPYYRGTPLLGSYPRTLYLPAPRDTCSSIFMLFFIFVSIFLPEKFEIPATKCGVCFPTSWIWTWPLDLLCPVGY